jgi:hypothetical protein
MSSRLVGGIITWKREKGIAHRYGQNLLLGRYNFALQLSDLICVCFRSDIDSS